MANSILLKSGVLLACAASPFGIQAQTEAVSQTKENTVQTEETVCNESASSRPLFEVSATTIANFSSGDFAPYYIASGSQALTTQGNGIQEYIRIERPLRRESRFEYGYGAALLGGYTSNVDYSHYEVSTGTFTYTGRHPGYFSVRELWGGVKWRSLFAYAGMKPEDRSLFNSSLGVGDLVLSNNARPIPQIRLGFIDFQDIPLTRGWVQIQGELAYGKFTDSSWLEKHYNYYNSFLTTGVYMHYSRLYLRSNPSKPFSVTVGMQHAAQFGGVWQQYSEGIEISSQKQPVKIKDFVNALFPWTGGSATTAGDQAYFSGNHLGSWDLKATYRFESGALLNAYMQSPWEDGSGIGKLNGFDGVWGLEYRFGPASKIVKEIVAEYVDLTNQSGPMHWAPGDYPGTSIPGEATGADDYYNNYMYNGWANYGMSIGTPFVKSPIYNTDGYLRFTDNRVRGFQLGASGNVGNSVQWRALFSFRTSLGTPFLPSEAKRHCTSILIEAGHDFKRIKGLSLGGALALDAGSLYGKNAGAVIKLCYRLPVGR